MPADAAGYEGAGWVQVWGLLEEILEGDLLLPDPFQPFNRVAGKPSDDFVELADSPAFAFYLLNVVRIDIGEGNRKNAVRHGGQYIGGPHGARRSFVAILQGSHCDSAMLSLPFDHAVERQKEGTRSRRETAWGALFCEA